jgi:hypothetical protein
LSHANAYLGGSNVLLHIGAGLLSNIVPTRNLLIYSTTLAVRLRKRVEI